MIKALVMAFLAVAGASSVAASGPPSVIYKPTGGTISYGGQPLSGYRDVLSLIPKNTGVAVLERVAVPGPLGATIEVFAERQITKSALGAAARLALGPLGMAATAAVVFGPAVIEAFRARGMEVDSDGWLTVDPGQGMTNGISYSNDSVAGRFEQQLEMRSVVEQKIRSTSLAGKTCSSEQTVNSISADGITGNVTWKFECSDSLGAYPPFFLGYNWRKHTDPYCQASPSTLPQSGALPCPTTDRVRAPAPILDVGVPAAVDAMPPAQLPDVLRDILATPTPVPASTPTVAGPSNVPGREVVTQKPDGTTETIQENFPITYEGDSYTWNRQETTINNGGTTTTTTTNEVAQDPCIVDPQRVGCLHLGDPSGGNVTRNTKNIAFDPVTVAGAVGCPSPIAAVYYGREIEFSFQPTCDFATTYARAVILLTAAVAAAFIFIGGFKA